MVRNPLAFERPPVKPMAKQTAHGRRGHGEAGAWGPKSLVDFCSRKSGGWPTFIHFSTRFKVPKKILDSILPLFAPPVTLKKQQLDEGHSQCGSRHA